MHRSTELFRFARLSPTRVLDIEHRARALGLPQDAQARAAWACELLDQGGAVTTPTQLAFPYLEHLKPEHRWDAGLPSRDDLRDPAGFARTAIATHPAYVGDLDRARRTLLAVTFAEPRKDDAERAAAAALVQFVERFPSLATAARRERFAPLLARRAPRIAKSRERVASTAPSESPQPAQLRRLAGALRTVWQARKQHLEALHRDHLAARRERAALPQADGPTVLAEARATATRSVLATKASFEAAAKTDALAPIVDGTAVPFVAHLAPERVSALQDAIATIRELFPALGLTPMRFCEAIAEVQHELDQLGVAAAPPAVGAPALPSFETPTVDFDDTVQVLGKAELIRVDEELVSYAAGEINYIQAILAGEKRLREVRSENTAETSVERVQEEQTERAQESSVSTKSELKSEIESELRTRFDSNLNATGSAQGGGTLGLVRGSGSASVGASVGLGVDTGMRTKDESNFVQEIVEKGLERTIRRTMERRLTRNVQTHSARDVHEVDNTTGEMLNGTYVFLDKRVAIKETTYGVRAFLEAKLLLPGQSLVNARRNRVRAAEDTIGKRPRFDLTPADITPENYLRLTGEFKAQNVEPPPPPVSMLTRVYKTDASTASAEREQFNGKKLADVLVPFFGQYQRYLITDNVDLPDGYEVLDATVAVSHGANGMSIPAHLPFTLPTTALYAGASFTPFIAGILGIAFLPAWLWSVAYMGSPLLHYNADSSNVTVTVGTEAHDSPYFFFPPDELLTEITTLLTSLAAISPTLITDIQNAANTAIDEMADAADDVPTEIAGRVSGALAGAISSVRSVLDHLVHGNVGAALDAFNATATPPSVSLDNLLQLPEVFTPLRTFVGSLAGMVSANLGTAIAQAFDRLLTRLEPSQTLWFLQAEGLRGRMPVTINALALKPGVTITVSACLRRTDEALARWQLRTFEALYQGHLQLVAAYENRLYQQDAAGLERAPGLLRRDEHLAVKERVLLALNARRDDTPATFDLARLELFEHALDWDNMSYRLFNYGPSEREMKLERTGVMAGTDETRRLFLLATWAQVLIPVQAHEGLERQILNYFAGGTARVEDAVTDPAAAPAELDELAALYRDLVLDRALGSEVATETRFAVVPTNLVALYRPDLADELPRNPAFPET